jgi:hypothetical protein
MSKVNLRFKDLEWVKLAETSTVLILGIGGIGSWVSLLLSRIGCNLYLFDDDIVDQTNLSGQHFKNNDINSNKVDIAIRDAKEYSLNSNVEAFGKYDNDSITNSIVISCFDNMTSRKIAFDKWKVLPERKLFIDGRMLAESFQIFTVQKGMEKVYEEYLFNDNEIPDLACSSKATSHCGAMIGAKIVSIFTNFIYNQTLNSDLRFIPFKLYYDIELMHEHVESN